MLHAHIINFRLREAVSLIKQPGVDLEAFDEEDGLTPLQRAAREGQEEVVKNLLLVGATVERVNVRFQHQNPWIQSQATQTPLSLARQSGHTSIARILVVAGANPKSVHGPAQESKRAESSEARKDLTLAELSGLILWIIENASGDLPNNFFNQLLTAFVGKKSQTILSDWEQNVDGLIEFAVQSKKVHFAKALLAASPSHKIRCDFNIPSAAYWAAISMPEMFEELCPTDQHWVIAILQLQRRGKWPTSEALFQKASQLRKDLLTAGEHPFDLEEKLPANLRRIYQAAGQQEPISKYCLTKPEECYQLVLHAFVHKNFVALRNLLILCDSQLLSKILIEREQHELMQFWLITDSSDWIHRLLNWCHKEVLTQFVNTYWSLDGFLHSVISYRLVNPQLQLKTHDLLGNYEPLPKAALAFNLQRCVVNRHKMLCYLPDPITFPIHIETCVAEQHQDLVATLFEEFHLEVRRSEKGVNEIDAWINILNKDCVQLVLAYLDKDNHRRLLEEDLPNRMRNYIWQLNPDTLWTKRNKLIQLEHKIALLKMYRNSLDRAEKAKPCWQKILLSFKSGWRANPITYTNLWSIMPFIVVAGISFGFLPRNISNRHEAYLNLHQTLSNGTFCDELYHVTEEGSYCDKESFMSPDCAKVCTDLYQANEGVILANAFGTATVAVFFVMALAVMGCLLLRGRRWDHLRADDLSSDVASNQQSLLNFYAAEEVNPFADFNNNSEYKQIEAKAVETSVQVESEFAQIKKELADATEDKKAPSLEEIVIDREYKSSSSALSLDETDTDGESKTPPSSPGRAGYFSKSKQKVEDLDLLPLLAHESKTQVYGAGMNG